MFKPHLLLTGSGSAIAATVVDYFAGWNLVPNPIYFVPVALFAWQASRSVGLWLAAISLIGFTSVQLIAPHRGAVQGIAFATFGVQIAGCVGIALLADGVRRLLQTCRRGVSPLPIEEQAAGARATMRRLSADGSSRPRGNLDRL